MNYSIAHRPMVSFVEQHARMESALKTGDNYRDLSVAGTTLSAPPAAIQGQWTSAMSMKPKVVVMTGGGNDVLINNPQCRPEGSEEREDCKAVVQASLDATTKMFASMKEAGVSRVISSGTRTFPRPTDQLREAISISDYTFPMLYAIAKSRRPTPSTRTCLPTRTLRRPPVLLLRRPARERHGTANIMRRHWK